MCYLTWHQEFGRDEITLEDPCRSHLVTKVPDKRESEVRERNATLRRVLALKLDEGVVIQGITVASRRRKRRGDGFSSRASRRGQRPADTLTLDQ